MLDERRDLHSLMIRCIRNQRELDVPPARIVQGSRAGPRETSGSQQFACRGKRSMRLRNVLIPPEAIAGRHLCEDWRRASCKDELGDSLAVDGIRYGEPKVLVTEPG